MSADSGTLKTLRLAATTDDGHCSLPSTFVAHVFLASESRRLDDGADGLWEEASIATVGYFRSRIACELVLRSGVMLWSRQDFAALADDLSRSLRSSAEVNGGMKQALRLLRDDTLSDPRFTFCDGYLSAFHPSEPPMSTMRRALDYIDHIQGSPKHASLFPLRWLLTNWLRAGEAVAKAQEPDGPWL